MRNFEEAGLDFECIDLERIRSCENVGLPHIVEAGVRGLSGSSETKNQLLRAENELLKTLSPTKVNVENEIISETKLKFKDFHHMNKM